MSQSGERISLFGALRLWLWLEEVVSDRLLVDANSRHTRLIFSAAARELNFLQCSQEPFNYKSLWGLLLDGEINLLLSKLPL